MSSCASHRQWRSVASSQGGYGIENLYSRGSQSHPVWDDQKRSDPPQPVACEVVWNFKTLSFSPPQPYASCYVLARWQIPVGGVGAVVPDAVPSLHDVSPCSFLIHFISTFCHLWTSKQNSNRRLCLVILSSVKDE